MMFFFYLQLLSQGLQYLGNDVARLAVRNEKNDNPLHTQYLQKSNRKTNELERVVGIRP